MIEPAHQEAKKIFGDQVTEILPFTINAYQSFMVGPDGSKEGWPESDAGDQCREEFVESLRSLAYDDGSTNVQWVEVRYADDNKQNRVVRSSK
jgi:hypothetical protein